MQYLFAEACVSMTMWWRKYVDYCKLFLFVVL